MWQERGKEEEEKGDEEKEDAFVVLRREELSTRDGGVYLDYAGAPPPPRRLLEAVFEELMHGEGEGGGGGGEGGGGNPHSSRASQERLEQARELVLDYFGASREEYDCIFTSGATASIKLVGEAFPFGKRGVLLYPANVHTSLLGMRAFARNAVCFSSACLYEQEHQQEKAQAPSSSSSFASSSSSTSSAAYCNLMVVPGECNFSGARVDLSCSMPSPDVLLASPSTVIVCDDAKLEGEEHEATTAAEAATAAAAAATAAAAQPEQQAKWYYLLDAAKLAGSARIDLSNSCTKFDFVVLSFYKLFGYPTGLGALLVRRETAELLRSHKRYFGGGTLLAGAATSLFAVPREQHPHEWLEDGTPHFQGIGALKHGFAFFARMGGIEAIATHCSRLTTALASRLLGLVHANGAPAVKMYGRRPQRRQPPPPQPPQGQAEESIVGTNAGPVIAFNLFLEDGQCVGFARVAHLAQAAKIRLRTGCFCNVGACQEYLELSSDDVRDNVALGRSCWDDSLDVDLRGRPTGAVRVSLGYGSNQADCDALIAFVQSVLLAEQQQQSRKKTRFFASPTSSSGSSGSNSGSSSGLILRDIFVYPIKSCAGMKVSRWPLSSCTHGGLWLDREWVVVDNAGKALTQKTHPRLSLVSVEADLGTKQLFVRAPVHIMQQVLVVPFDEESARSDEGHHEDEAEEKEKVQTVCVRVCGQGRNGVGAASAWFSTLLGTSCRLVRKASSGTHNFANEAQLLLVCAESIEALCVPGTSNFRPNLVVASDSSSSGSMCHLDEKSWSRISCNDGDCGALLTFNVTGPCARCVVVDVDVQSGTRNTTGQWLRAAGGTFGLFLQQVARGEGEGACMLESSCVIHVD